jgi:hypothetical protein
MISLSLLALLSLFAPQLRAEDPKPNTIVYRPVAMSVMIGGAFGKSYEITYDERKLRYYSAKNFFELKATKAVVVEPTEEQWQEFFDALEEQKVWKWKRRYENTAIADGTSWRAVISYPTRDPRDVVSSGSNAYPPNFKAFLAAVRKLIGERKFE